MNKQDEILIKKLSNKIENTKIKKDLDAEKLINNTIAIQKDSTYILTQVLLLQEEVIKNLKNQIESYKNKNNGFFKSLFRKKEESINNNTINTQDNFGKNSFLKSMINTAAGVAGGMLLFEGINSFFNNDNKHKLENYNNDNLIDNNNSFNNLDKSTLNEDFGENDNTFIDNNDNNYNEEINNLENTDNDSFDSFDSFDNSDNSDNFDF